MMDDFDRRIIEEFKELERQMGRMLRSSSLSRMIPITSSGGWQPAVGFRYSRGSGMGH